MIGIGTPQVLKISNAFFGTPDKSYTKLAEKIEAAKEELLAEWQESLDSAGGPAKGPAYSVYHKPAYVFEGIHCFKKSKIGACATIEYFTGLTVDEQGKKYAGSKFEDLEILDLYNGVGLTTAVVILNGGNIETVNDCEPQVQYMRTALEVSGANPLSVKNYTSSPKKKKYDVVLSFEVFEHFSDPLIHLKEIMDLLKPGGYLVESSGFNGSSKNIGHFDSYPILGWLMPYVKARQILTKIMLKFFTLVQSNFNTNPRIWKRNDVPFTPFSARMCASCCWDMFPKQYGFNSEVFVNLDGTIFSANGDRILESADRHRVSKGLSSVFAGEKQVYRCNEGWEDLFTKMEC